MKRRGIAAVIAFLAAALGITAAAGAAPVAAQALRPFGAQGVSQPDKVTGGPAKPCALGGFITWQSAYFAGYALSNDGWSTKNDAPILSYRWLNQQNQCFYDYMLSNGNWIEQLAFDGNAPGLSGQCMEDPAWKANAGVDQYACTYWYQLNEQWIEGNFTGVCGDMGAYGYALQNEGVTQNITFNVQNGQALLRDYDASTNRQCWY